MCPAPGSRTPKGPLHVAVPAVIWPLSVRRAGVRQAVRWAYRRSRLPHNLATTATKTTPLAAAAVPSTIEAGYDSTCSLQTDGTMVCWGSTTGLSGTFSSMSIWIWDACAVRTNGTLACWGSNSDGESIPPSGTFRPVSAGYSHTCACARTAPWFAGATIFEDRSHS